jgi:hypothetical protein
LTITAGTSGTGNGSISVTVAANTGAPRSGTVSVDNQTATISQASGCTFSVSPTDFMLTGTASTGQTIAVTAGNGCSWTATTSDPWITITAGADGTGNGTVRFGVTENAGGTRRGSLTVAGTTVDVRQASH